MSLALQYVINAVYLFILDLLLSAKDPSRKTLAKELKEEESILKQCIGKLKEVENNRVALVDQLRDALQEQVVCQNQNMFINVMNSYIESLI